MENKEFVSREAQLISELAEDKKHLKEWLEHSKKADRSNSVEVESINIQIRMLKEQIEKKSKELNAIRANKSNAAGESKTQEVAKPKKVEETRQEEKARLYKQIKRSYSKRKGRGFERFVLLVSGRAPKWGKIKGYTLDELRYLDQASNGQTRSAIKSVNFLESFLREKGKDNREINKKVNNTKWNHFVNALTDRSMVDRGVKSESSGVHIR